MRGTISGCESATLMSAKPRTQARAARSFGRSGGSGYFSSRYSRIASDWNNFASPSIQGRHNRLRVARLVVRLELVALIEVDEGVLARQALEVERDAHAEAACERK